MSEVTMEIRCCTKVVSVIMLFFKISIVFGKVQNHMGTEFLVAAMENRVLAEEPAVKLFLTSGQAVPVNVSISRPLQKEGGLSFHGDHVNLIEIDEEELIIIQSFGAAVYQYNYEAHMTYDYNEDGTKDTDKAILIRATLPITLQVASVNDLSSDAYLALPRSNLGTEYYVMSYIYPGETRYRQGPSQFAIIGSEDGTEVEILGDVLQNFLHVEEFETYQFQSSRDLTGTRIVSNKPIAVLSGSVWTSVGAELMGDHVVEMLSPTNTWGREFLTLQIANRTSGDVFRITGRDNSTRVRIISTQNGSIDTVAVLDSGQYFEFDGPSDQGLYLVANKPIQLAQFCKSWGADAKRYSDPFMSIVPAVSQYLSDYVFSTVTSLTEADPYRHYLSLIIPTKHTGGIKLDEQTINPDLFVIEWTKVGKTTFSYAAIALTQGRHHLYHDTPSVTFGAQLYGIKLQEAYGHPLGQRLEAIENICIQALMIEKDYFDNDCDGRYDEEILNGIDDDGDGLVDEDVFDEFGARPQSHDAPLNVIKGDGGLFDEEITDTTNHYVTTQLPKTTTMTEMPTAKRYTTPSSETMTMKTSTDVTPTEQSTVDITSTAEVTTVITAETASETTEGETITSIQITTTNTKPDKTTTHLLSTYNLYGKTNEASTELAATTTKLETTWKTAMISSVIISTLITSTLGNYTTTFNNQHTTSTSGLFDLSTNSNITTISNVTLNNTEDGNNTSTGSLMNATDYEAVTNSTNTSEWETTFATTEAPVKEDESFNVFRENPGLIAIPIMIVLGLPSLYCLYHLVKAIIGSKCKKNKKSKIHPKNRLEKQFQEDKRKGPYLPYSQGQSLNVDMRPKSRDDLMIQAKPKRAKKPKKPIVG